MGTPAHRVRCDSDRVTRRPRFSDGPPRTSASNEPFTGATWAGASSFAKHQWHLARAHLSSSGAACTASGLTGLGGGVHRAGHVCTVAVQAIEPAPIQSGSVFWLSEARLAPNGPRKKGSVHHRGLPDEEDRPTFRSLRRPIAGIVTQPGAWSLTIPLCRGSAKVGAGARPSEGACPARSNSLNLRLLSC